MVPHLGQPMDIKGQDPILPGKIKGMYLQRQTESRFSNIRQAFIFRDADPELPTSQPHSSNEATDIKSKSNHSEPTKPFIYCIFFVNLIVFSLLKP